MKFLIVLSNILAITFAAPSGIIPLAPRTHVIAAPIIPARTQYHAQDALGQYSYGYTDGLSAKQEIKTIDGTTLGSYSYVDAEGKLQTVDYTADALNGFRVASTNLPKVIAVPNVQLPEPISDTVEVEAARQEHLVALEDAKTRAIDATRLEIESAQLESEKIQDAAIRSAEEISEEIRSAESKAADRISEEISTAERKSDEIRTAQVESNLPQQVEDTPEVARAKIEHLAAKQEAELRTNIIVNTVPLVRNAAFSTVPLTTLKTAQISTLPVGTAAIRTLNPAEFAIGWNGWNGLNAWNAPVLRTSVIV